MGYFNPKSLTFWSGIGLIAIGATRLFAGDADNGLKTLTEGLALIGIRRAIG